MSVLTPWCPLEVKNTANEAFEATIGLGGFAYLDVFGLGSEDPKLGWDCSTMCDGGGTTDTHVCASAHLPCGKVTCMTEVRDQGEEPRACPLTEHGDNRAAGEFNGVDLKPVRCQSCSRCGELQADLRQSMVDGSISGWGTGCARECSMLLCESDEIFDWTDHRCKPCDSLWNAALCQRPMATQDVTGNLLRVHFPMCRTKSDVVLASSVTYGECEECAPHTCVGDRFPDSGCVCSDCVRDGAHTRTYVNSTGGEDTVYCQIGICSDRQRTGVAVDGTLCAFSCRQMTCREGERMADAFCPTTRDVCGTFPKHRHSTWNSSENSTQLQTY